MGTTEVGAMTRDGRPGLVSCSAARWARVWKEPEPSQEPVPVLKCLEPEPEPEPKNKKGPAQAMLL